MELEIRGYRDETDRDQVILLWNEVFGYEDLRNDPGGSLDRKLAIDDMVYVALSGGDLVGAIMAGYDGHRGWLYSLAVAREERGIGIGTALVKHAESALFDLGCIKINLQAFQGNLEARDFYSRLGYDVEDRISMGRELTENLVGGSD